MPQVGFTAPDGTFYRWNRRTPPTQADIDALVAYHDKTRASGPPRPKAQAPVGAVAGSQQYGPPSPGPLAGILAGGRAGSRVAPPGGRPGAVAMGRILDTRNVLRPVVVDPGPAPTPTPTVVPGLKGSARRVAKGPSILVDKNPLGSKREMLIEAQKVQSKRPVVEWNGQKWAGDPFEGLPFTRQEFQASVNDPDRPVRKRDGSLVPYARAARMVTGRTGEKSFKLDRSPSDVEEARNLADYTDAGRAGLGKTVGFDRSEKGGVLRKGDGKDTRYRDREGKVARTTSGVMRDLAGRIGDDVEKNVQPFLNEAANPIYKLIDPESKFAASLVRGVVTTPVEAIAEAMTATDPNETAEVRSGAAANLFVIAATSAVGGEFLAGLSKPARTAIVDAAKGTKLGKLVWGAKSPEAAVAAVTKTWKVGADDARRLVSAMTEGRYTTAKAALADVDKLSPGRYDNLVQGAPQHVRDMVEGRMAGGDRQGARETVGHWPEEANRKRIAQKGGTKVGMKPSAEQVWEGQLSRAVKRGVVSEDEALDIADLWSKRAEAWTKEGPKRSKDGFYAQYAPRLVFDEAVPKGALNQVVSTRVPTAKNATEDALKGALTIDLRSSRLDPKAFQKNVELFRNYPGMGHLGHDPEAIVGHMKDNLLWLHDNVPDVVRKEGRKWYDGGRRIVESWAERYGKTTDQTAAALASLSPQKDWYQNVSLAERILDIMSTKSAHRWDEAMDATAARIWKDKDAKLVGLVRGKQLGELTDADQKALWIRTYDEAHHPRGYREVAPDGTFGDFVTTGSGERRKVGWGSNKEVSKAVSILEDGSPENISIRLGEQHKVRSFNNNLFDPNAPGGHVTIDTHAVAADQLRPLSGSSTEVTHNFGGAGASSSAVFGAKGTYGIHADAYQKAAAEAGILPREMQSITWEGVRGLFTPTFKGQQKNIDLIDAIWREYEAGRISLDDARLQVADAAGGIRVPGWAEDGRHGADARVHRSSYLEGDLPGGGLSRRGADALDGGVGVDAARGVAGLEPADPRKLAQKGTRGGVKGAVSFATNERPVVHLFKNVSDVSTLLHESAHVWRRSLPAEEVQLLARRFGKVGSRDFEERFARGVERYLADGVAPSEDLVPVFERFKRWLGDIYGKVRDSAIGDELDDEVRGAFDRMLGKDAPAPKAATNGANRLGKSRNPIAKRLREADDETIRLLARAAAARQAWGLRSSGPRAAPTASQKPGGRNVRPPVESDSFEFSDGVKVKVD